MAIKFIEGFDNLPLGELGSQKGWTGDATYITVSDDGRNGNCVKNILASGGTRNVFKAIPGSHVVFGTAFYSGDDTLDTEFCFYNPSGNVAYGLIVAIDGATGGLSVRYLNTQKGTGNFALPINSWMYLEMRAFIDNTNGYIVVRVNGVEVYNDTGVDTQYSSFGPITTLRIQMGPQAKIDDIYCKTSSSAFSDSDFLGDVKVETLFPSGAGNSANWTPSAGNNYECVDESPGNNSDTDYISSDTATDVDTFAFDDLVTAGGDVHAVQTNIVARKDDAGSRSIKPVVRPGSTDNEGTEVGIGDTYTFYQEVFETNPDTASAWSIAEVNASEFGVKLES